MLQHLRSGYDELFPALSISSPDIFASEFYTWEQYQWACELWYSNSMKIMFPDGKLRTCLVPIAGFLNHSVRFLVFFHWFFLLLIEYSVAKSYCWNSLTLNLTSSYCRKSASSPILVLFIYGQLPTYLAARVKMCLEPDCNIHINTFNILPFFLQIFKMCQNMNERSSLSSIWIKDLIIILLPFIAKNC